jgi:hypothetical protein
MGLTLSHTLRSADLERTNGFADYNDLATATTAIPVPEATWTAMTNDAAGPFTNTLYLPPGVTSLWDTAAQAFDFSDLALGDTVLIRLEYEIETITRNTDVDTRIRLGTGGAAYSIPIAQTTPYKNLNTYVVSSLQLLYMGDTNTRDNGGVIEIYADKAVSLKVNGWAVAVNRHSF